jgi:tetratricopeptide (TPR) repeat protein
MNEERLGSWAARSAGLRFAQVLGLCAGIGLFAGGTVALMVGGRTVFAAVGTWALLRGRAPLSEQWFIRAQQYAPDVAEAPFNLGVALQGQGRFAAAAQSFSRAAASSRSDVDRSASLYNLASAYVGAGQLAQALDCLEASLRANPADDEARYNYVLVKRWLADRSPDRMQALKPPPELTREEVERLLNQLGAVPLRSKSQRAPVPTGRPDW